MPGYSVVAVKDRNIYIYIDLCKHLMKNAKTVTHCHEREAISSAWLTTGRTHTISKQFYSPRTLYHGRHTLCLFISDQDLSPPLTRARADRSIPPDGPSRYRPPDLPTTNRAGAKIGAKMKTKPKSKSGGHSIALIWSITNCKVSRPRMLVGRCGLQRLKVETFSRGQITTKNTFVLGMSLLLPSHGFGGLKRGRGETGVSLGED